MNDNKILDQAEIDALLRAAAEGLAPAGEPEQPLPEGTPGTGDASAAGMVAGDGEPVMLTPDGGNNYQNILSPEEKDALGEVGNISMGSAATTLSQLLNQKVVITSPRVHIYTQRQLFASFQIPYILIQVEFTEGLQGFNVLVIKMHDAMIIADLMMGGSGAVEMTGEIGELELSAASEAMNQMIGTASTSLANMFGQAINIAPPNSIVLREEDKDQLVLPVGDPVVVVSFQMKIGDLVDTELMQIMSLETARKQAALLMAYLSGGPVVTGDAPAQAVADNVKQQLGGEIYGDGLQLPPEQNVDTAKEQAAPARDPATGLGPVAAQTPPARPAAGYAASGLLTPEEQRKLELLLDVPLKVSVVLGRTRRPIREVLNLTPGAIVELNSLVDEPVEVLVNGTLVARGEVVVVNENFGVRLTTIISPEERLRQLTG
ncbi:flagellar motor switch phosphatase FliY [Desulfurispora thermophila]|uniref:flagellar motor switch phosphatase FliY n=1 Tax=Desulfurispora thermophila TaxID=265470 RepID=UPI00035FADA8|nr:flagellar motor switch phosphatase FliY [Desulfurispora thermophila]